MDSAHVDNCLASLGEKGKGLPCLWSTSVDEGLQYPCPQTKMMISSEPDSSDTESQSTKSGPLLNKVQEEAKQLHEDYIVKLEALATQCQVNQAISCA